MRFRKHLVLLSAMTVAACEMPVVQQQATSVSFDELAILSVVPADAATSVDRDSTISAQFETDIDVTTMTSGAFYLATADGMTTVSGSLDYVATSRTLVFEPTTELDAETAYTAHITDALKDTDGRTNAFSWTFTTDSSNIVDDELPTVVSVTPADQSDDVALDAVLTVTFSEEMDAATISSATISLVNGPGVTVAYQAKVATIVPNTTLASDTVYSARINTGVTDLAGNPLANQYDWSFTTGDSLDETPPTLVTQSPSANATDVELSSSIEVTFDEALDCSTVKAGSLTLMGPGGSVSGALNCSGSMITFAPNAPLDASASYTVTLTSSIEDLAGNAFAGATWSFSTTAAVDDTPPTVVSWSPTTGATSVPLDQTMTVTFSEPVDCDSITSVNFAVLSSSLPPAPVSGTVVCSGATLSLDPDGALAPNKTHAIRVGLGVTDLAGNSIEAVAVSTFVTIAQDDTAPTVVSISPDDGTSNISLDTQIVAVFSESIDCSTVNSSSFIVNGPVGIVAGSIACTNSTVTFTPGSTLLGDSAYSIEITTAVTDLLGNALASTFSSGFLTEAEALSALLSWVAPTTNTDGSTLDDLSGFEVHYGTESSETGPDFDGYDASLSISAASACTGTACQFSVTSGLVPGTNYFAVRAYDYSSNQSAFSLEAEKTFN